MRAVIFRSDEQPGAGARDVAGRPLLERQLQWLRGQQIDQVAVELGSSDADVRLATWLLGDDPLVDQVTTVPTDGPLGPEALAARAGFDRESGVLELPAHALCEVDLGPWVEAAQSVRLAPEVPSCPGTSPLRLTLRFLFGELPDEAQPAQGWCAAVEDAHGALALGGMILEGKLRGPLVHAAEQSPGVWVARGAHVAEGAHLNPPVFVGAGAYVAAGAHVGPLAVLLADAVVEREAVVTEALVLHNTVVGEGVQVRRSVATPHSLLAFRDGEHISVGDDLVLDSRRAPTRAVLPGRLIAAALLAALTVPWLLMATIALMSGRSPIEGEKWPDGHWLRQGKLGVGWLDVWPRLVDVVLGRRFLVGATNPSAGVCPAAFDIGPRLAPAEMPQIVQRMWPWYASHKSPRLDRQLLLRSRPRG